MRRETKAAKAKRAGRLFGAIGLGLAGFGGPAQAQPTSEAGRPTAAQTLETIKAQGRRERETQEWKQKRAQLSEQYLLRLRGPIGRSSPEAARAALKVGAEISFSDFLKGSPLVNFYKQEIRSGQKPADLIAKANEQAAEVLKTHRLTYGPLRRTLDGRFGSVVRYLGRATRGEIVDTDRPVIRGLEVGNFKAGLEPVDLVTAFQANTEDDLKQWVVSDEQREAVLAAQANLAFNVIAISGAEGLAK